MNDSQGIQLLTLNDRAQNLLSYANKKRKSGFFNDISIQAGNKRFPCNKMVLSCYSIYFESMFESEMREKYEKTVLLEGLEEAHVELLIDYMYGELVAIDDENVFPVLAAADYLQIDAMKTFCFDFLKKGLKVENCLNALNASNLYMPTASNDHIYQFISEHFAIVTKQDKFKLLSFNNLASLLEQLNRKKDFKSELLYSAVIDWVAAHREERKFDFASLFQLIDLSKLSRQFLTDVVSVETLVKQNADCLNTVMTAIFANPKPAISTHNFSEKNLILVLGGNQKYSVMAIQNISDKTNVTFFSKLPIDLIRQSSNKVKSFIFCIGGTVIGPVSRFCTSKVHRMDLSEQKMEWKEVCSMNERRSDHNSALFKGSIVVSGGQRTNIPLKSVESYSVSANTWKVLKAMNICRNGHAMVVCDNRLYALGGTTSWNTRTFLSSVETLSELHVAWETGPAMNRARCYFAAVCFNGEIYAIGGKSEKGIEKSVEKFVPTENKWFFYQRFKSSKMGVMQLVCLEKRFL